jgi:hypothetical protein
LALVSYKGGYELFINGLKYSAPSVFSTLIRMLGKLLVSMSLEGVWPTGSGQ